MQIKQIYTYGHDDSCFGGKLYIKDFEMCPVGNMASRIFSDMRFDKECRESAEFINKIRKDDNNE